MRLLRPIALSCLAAAAAVAQPPPVAVDTSGFRAENGAVIEPTASRLRLEWPVSANEQGEIVFNLDPAAGQPLIDRIAMRAGTAAASVPLIERVNPVTLLTIGERDLANPAGWVAFFDNPPQRPYRIVAAVLAKKSARVTSSGTRTTVRIEEVTAGSFRGALEFTVCRHSPLVLVETVVQTNENGRAILYDTGIVGAPPGWPALVWRDPSGKLQRAAVEPSRVVTTLKVGGRAVAAEAKAGAGSVAVVALPHQYFYPLDFADNLGFAWHGASGNALMRGYGFGVQQPPHGDRRFVPWFNAPPGTAQRLGVFWFVSREPPERALDAIAEFTRQDRYKKLPGYRTFTSHYHIEHTLEVMRKRTEQGTSGVPRGLEVPGFVQTFKARGVDIVHLAEFHVGGTPRLPTKERLAQLQTLHEECARVSDAELLVLPGEEPNVHLGGHWLSFFPKPVYWVLNRTANQPFAEDVPGYGTVYHVGSADDVLRLMEKEHGLMWTAHARIKGSRGFPDAYWDQPFFRSDRFLGAAWKAMPADLSLPRLGSRVLDLLDDMANAGLRKHVIAEADLFRMEPDYESYAPMNINYVQLDRLPRFGDGWQPVLDGLREGKFFATTGEVLIPECALRGATLEAAVEWTFPLAFAEVISGDGRSVHRQRIDLTDTEPFGQRRLKIPIELAGRTWVRLEVWDMARNGAFTQPIFLP